MSCRRFKAFAFVAALILAVSPAVVAVPKKPPAEKTTAQAMSVCQARRAIVEEMRRVSTVNRGDQCMKSLPSNVIFNGVELSFQAEPKAYKNLFPRETYKINLKNLGEITIKRDTWFFDSNVLIDGNDPLWGGLRESEKNARKNLSKTSILGFISWFSMDNGNTAFGNAQVFANAMNVLRLYARTYDPSQGMPPACFADKDEQARIWAEFQKRAAAWRALPAKPPISDDVKQHRLLAEDAFNQKQFDTAAAEYEAGLEIDPHWAQGHFNAALIYGELKDYDDAIWHMRCYLELTPDAPDAQEARDQMLLWQGKARQLSATQ